VVESPGGVKSARGARSTARAIVNLAPSPEDRYTTDAAAAPERLGFLIDDTQQTPAVAPDATHIDLYGYTSMVVAAVQAQAKEIEALRREVAELRRASRAQRARQK
jgi:hypothetical protein